MSVPAIHHKNEVAATEPHFNEKQIQILKNSICKGISDEEFEIFLMACARTKLDPFMKQIYAIPRRTKNKEGQFVECMTIQTSIDGYRLIAERTGLYAPGPEPTYTYNAQGRVVSATAYIKKQTKDGTWHTISASAYYDEYCQSFVNKNTGERVPTGLWQTMPRTMLAKCAESQALRKAFPAEMSGIYTKEEMEQADVEIIEQPKPLITDAQAQEIEMILAECDERFVSWLKDTMQSEFGSREVSAIRADKYEQIKQVCKKNMEETHAKQKVLQQ